MQDGKIHHIGKYSGFYGVQLLITNQQQSSDFAFIHYLL